MLQIPLAKNPENKIPTLFILKNSKPKIIGIAPLCHWLDWRIDLYFIGWTIWIEEVEYGVSEMQE